VSGERLRLFVALALPSQITQTLVSWCDDALRGLRELRLLDSEHLHVTLCFLGWQAAEAAGPICAACQEIASVVGAPELILGGALWLPPRRPRVLAVELDDLGRGLGELQSALSERLQEGGWYLPERRPYLGHVTVARVRRGATSRPVVVPDPPKLRFTASQVTVFRSLLSPAGARYEAIAQLGIG
jgi:RNA 2',3'-cyclic 3'-phosphodiesterase